jgi:adenosylmethionine-8-amino-7-oxononanoate aminotransferase
MEKRILTLRYGKWLGILMGCIMYAVTSSVFTISVSAALAVVFGVSFWILLKREEIRQIGQNIAESIREAVQETWTGEQLIEIKRIRRGMIARVYLIGQKSRMERVQQAVSEKMSENPFRNYLWVMQMTQLKSREEVRKARDVLNRQLVQSILDEAEKDSR